LTGKRKPKVYVFDTSALLTYIEDEDGADEVDDLLAKAETSAIQAHVCFISLTEVFYITLRERDEATAQRRLDLIKSLAVTIHESHDMLNVLAGRLKAEYRISLADAYVGALCQNVNGVLVHKDPEFNALRTVIRQVRLPLKQSHAVP
jgi:predicted nucleic acid-binding protein